MQWYSCIAKRRIFAQAAPETMRGNPQPETLRSGNLLTLVLYGFNLGKSHRRQRSPNVRIYTVSLFQENEVTFFVRIERMALPERIARWVATSKSLRNKIERQCVRLGFIFAVSLIIRLFRAGWHMLHPLCKSHHDLFRLAVNQASEEAL